MQESFISVKGYAESEYIIERSRFIGYTKRVFGEEEAKEFVEKIKKANSLATHNCYAYVADDVGNVMKFSDDGEPQGTAGIPILEVIKNRKLRNTAIVVTRYFGGIKLGAGGLVRAYTKAASDVLDKAGVVESVLSDVLKVTLGYDLYPSFLRFISGKKLLVKDSEFSNDVSIKLAMPSKLSEDFTNNLTDFLNGRVAIERICQGYEEYPQENK